MQYISKNTPVSAVSPKVVKLNNFEDNFLLGLPGSTTLLTYDRSCHTALGNVKNIDPDLLVRGQSEAGFTSIHGPAMVLVKKVKSRGSICTEQSP